MTGVRLRYLGLFVMCAAAVSLTSARQASPSATVGVQFLAINDLHGNLEPPMGSSGQVNGVPVGGAEYLATHLARAVAANPDSIIVAAGDLIGAAPLVSSLFHDEPTIEAANAMHVAVSSVGNHEFDHGYRELLRLKSGGCSPVDGCQGGHPFRGAAFDYLAANVVRTDTHQPLFQPTVVQRVGGVQVGFIGETMRDTPVIVSAAGTEGLTFLDEAETANMYAAQLTRQGVHAIALLVHQGGGQRGGGSLDPSGCADFTGPIRSVIERLSSDIGVVISGHTHRAYVCTIAGHLVTSAGAFGQMVTHVQVHIDRSTGQIVDRSATNQLATRDVPIDPTQTAILANYRPRAEQVGSKVVGSVTNNLLRRANAAGESVLGDVIADAFLEETRQEGAVVAFMNSGGIRADVSLRPRGDVSYGDLFAVQPFDNVLTVVTMTGAAIKELLEEQFEGPTGGPGNVLQVSNGTTYTYRTNAPSGQHVAPETIRIGGRPLTPTDSVRVAAPDFVIDGGGGYRAFGRGTGRKAVMSDLDAVIAYFKAHSPVGPTPQNRLVRVD